MDPHKALSELNHSQQERLAFIDFRLLYFGRVSRADLQQQFKTGPASATRDFTLYRKIAPDNLQLEQHDKIYYRHKAFLPLFEMPPETALYQLESGFSYTPKVASSTPQNSPNSLRTNVVSVLARAIHNKLIVECDFHSLMHKRLLLLAPHVFFQIESHWFVRGYDVSKEGFDNFPLEYFESVQENSSALPNEALCDEDTSWNKSLNVELVPHPSVKNFKAIETAFQMQEGSTIVQLPEAIAVQQLVAWRVELIGINDNSCHLLALKCPDKVKEYLR